MKKKIVMMDIFKNPFYRGKHVILAAGKVYTSKTGKGAAKILEKVRKKHPKAIPEVAYLPKTHSLVLGNIERKVPIAFFSTDQVPALLGRLGFMETINIEFLKSKAVVFRD